MPDLHAIRKQIPELFNRLIKDAGYNSDDFRVYGSVGQINFNMAVVPWVAICKRTVTTSATNGYYIVALFAEDMSSVTLSLNQGYTAFKQRYGSDRVAYGKLEDCARAARAKIPVLPGFTYGPIDLRTKRELARGYQAGSIMSKTYLAGRTPGEHEVRDDLLLLLKAYLSLANIYPKSLVDLDVDISEVDFQEALESFAVEGEGGQADVDIRPTTTGPQPLPAVGESKGKRKYVRSSRIPARALKMAKYTCSLATEDEPHPSFVSQRTEKCYVEAHHLIPFSYQGRFLNSLDVEENIIILCPNCHRKLHHATAREKNGLLEELLYERKRLLEARGIGVSLSELKSMYKSLSADD
ncbi:hypothetical protein RB25_17895 [Herbaspirillum rubrisubalbicans]|nr:hypothetical protein RB25_17895 [Herbaspirillum rubrisubalbicans]